MRPIVRMKRSRLLVSGVALGATILGSTGQTTQATYAAAAPPTWVTTQGKVVHLTLIAGYNNENSGFNFDGAAHGRMTSTVPLGATVDVTFKNSARGEQHNVVVIPYTKTLPASSSSPAFPGAATPTPKFTRGSAPQTTGAARQFSFTAGKTGRYTLICGIAGHAIAGMWDTFVVSSTAKTASITFK
ncbi:MAG: sulfocyanin-like copper-binding protein [Chloroflexota bacterium]